MKSFKNEIGKCITNKTTTTTTTTTTMTTILVRLIYGVQNHSKRSHCHKVGSEVFELFENRK